MFSDESASLGSKIQGVGGAMNNIGSTMTKDVTLPIVGAGVAMGKMAMDYEDSIAKVSTISDDAQVPLKNLSNEILKLSNDTGIASTEIANNVYDAISAGQQTGDSVNFVTNSTKLAKAGYAEAGQSLDLLTTILNSYGMASSEVNRVSDILIQTQNVGKVTVGELSESMGKVIPTANALGVNLEQVSVGYEIMTSKGIKAAETTTYMNSMLNEMGKSGSSASNAVKAATGKSFQDLMASGKSLGDVLAAMDGYAKKSGKSLSDMFGSSEAAKAALVLVTNAGQDFNKNLADMANVSGATDAAFEKVNSTANQKLKISLNQLKNTGIELGAQLLPYVNQFAQWLSKMVKAFSKLSPETKSFIMQIAGVIAVVGPALMIFGKIVGVIGSVVNAFKALSSVLSIGKTIIGAVSSIGGAFSSLGSLFAALPAIISSPVFIIIGIIALIGIAAYEIVKHWEQIKSFFSGLWDGIKSVFSAFWEWLKDFVGKWGIEILAVIAPFLGVPLLIVKHWDTIKKYFSDLFKNLKEDFSGFGRWIFDFFKNIGEELFNFGKNIFDGLIGGIKSKFGEVKDTVTGVGSTVISTFKGLLGINSPSKIFNGFGVNIGEGLVLGMGNQEDALQGKINNYADKIKSIGDIKPNIDINGLNDIQDAVRGNSIRNSANFLSSSVSKVVNPVINMYIKLSDTGNKGTEELKTEIINMGAAAYKDSMVDLFMKDAVRGV